MFSFFFTDNKIVFLRVFSYDLEIRNCLRNTTRGARSRSPNARQKKYVDFFDISSDSTKFQKLVQIYTQERAAVRSVVTNAGPCGSEVGSGKRRGVR